VVSCATSYTVCCRVDRIIKEWEGKKKPERLTVENAVKKYYSACEEQRLSPNTLKKYRTVRDVISKFSERHGITYLSEFGTQEVRDLLKERSRTLWLSNRQGALAVPEDSLDRGIVAGYGHTRQTRCA
jgi:hypothetical protein